MANFSFLKRQILPLSFLLFVNCALADIASDEAAAQKDIDDANAIIATAKTEYTKKEKECYEKVLVNWCLDSAQKEFKTQMDAGKALKKKANKALRKIKKEQNARKRAEQTANIQKHEEKLKQMEFKNKNPR